MSLSRKEKLRHLELKDGKYRVVLAVPRKFQSIVGVTKLKRSLRTDSLELASRIKQQVLQDLKAEMMAKVGGSAKEAFSAEALHVRELLMRARSDDEREMLEEGVQIRGEELRGAPVGEELDDAGRPYEVYDAVRELTAGSYVRIALGKATPLDAYHEQFIELSHTKARTQGDDRRALKYLSEWCRQVRLPLHVEAITRRHALQFMDALPDIAGGQQPNTLNKYLGRLSRYWQWLEGREVVTMNPWSAVKITPPPTSHDEKEREFTDAEVEKLLNGPASQPMHDLMRIAALTGARIEAIVDLKVAGCKDGVFIMKPQKKEKRPGTVRDFVSGAIVTPMEGAHGHQEGHAGSVACGA